MQHRLRRRYGHASDTSWAGTDYVDRRYYGIQPELAGVALGHGPLTPRDEEIIARGREFVVWLEQQRAPRSVRAYKERHIFSIRRLLEKVEDRL
jgi:hypothetical protein